MSGKLQRIKEMILQLSADYKAGQDLDSARFEKLADLVESACGPEPDIDFKEIVDNIDESIFITDSEGYVLYINPAYSRNTGVPPEDVLHKYVRDIIADGVFSGGSTIPVLTTGKKVFRLSTTYRTDPPRMGYTIGVPVFDENGSIKRVVVSSRPILTLTALKDDYSRFLKEAKSYTEDEIKIISRSEEVRSDSLLGDSSQLNSVRTLIKRVAPTDATVLITGESGVGKEVVADEIYSLSRRSDKPFIKVNCAAIPSSLLESELFGYEKGAFSGASPQGKKGLFELANQGTLLLDEIGDMPLDLQAKLLRAIQNKEIFRIGNTRPIPLDIRFIAATNSNLQQKVLEGAFRQDLYYRLRVIPIDIPPLRQRPSDIAPLCEHFLRQYGEKHQSKITLNEEQLRLLEQHHWPGNVRELENVIEYLIICHSGVEEVDEMMLRGLLDIDNALTSPNSAASGKDFSSENEAYFTAYSPLHPDPEPAGGCGSAATSNSGPIGLEESLAELEKKLILEALSKTKNLRQASRLLNISAPTLSRKIRQYQIDRNNLL